MISVPKTRFARQAERARPCLDKLKRSLSRTVGLDSVLEVFDDPAGALGTHRDQHGAAMPYLAGLAVAIPTQNGRKFRSGYLPGVVEPLLELRGRLIHFHKLRQAATANDRAVVTYEEDGDGSSWIGMQSKKRLVPRRQCVEKTSCNLKRTFPMVRQRNVDDWLSSQHCQDNCTDDIHSKEILQM